MKVCSHCTGDTFFITVTGNNPQPSSFPLSVSPNHPEAHQLVTLGPGNFKVTETLSEDTPPDRFIRQDKKSSI